MCLNRIVKINQSAVFYTLFLEYLVMRTTGPLVAVYVYMGTLEDELKRRIGSALFVRSSSISPMGFTLGRRGGIELYYCDIIVISY